MNAKIVRVVASLIAIALLCASTVSFAQVQLPQAPWSGVMSVEVPEWGTSDEVGNCQVITGTNQISCRYFSGANRTDIELLDGAANRPGLQLKRTSNKFYGFPRGTPGTVEMRRFMFCSVSLDCDSPSTIYSHVTQTEQVYDDQGNLITNPSFAWFRAPEQARYMKDEGYNGFNVVLPIKTANGSFCPSGTQPIYKWYNGAYQRSVSTPGYKNDGNWRFGTSYAWRDGSRPKGWETSGDPDDMFCGPIVTKGLWISNVATSSQIDAAGLRLYASYLDLSTFTRTDYGMGYLSVPFVDNSRGKAFFTQGQTRVNKFQSTVVNGVQQTINTPIDIATNPALLASLVDKKTGKLIVVEGATLGGGVWVQQIAGNSLVAPALANYLRLPDARGTNGLFNEEILRAQIVGLDGELLALWRGSEQTVDGYTKGQLIVYNIRDWIDRGVRTVVTIQLPDAPTTAGPARLGPPTYDVKNRRFWVNYGLQRAYGSVTFSEDFLTATVGEMKYLPLEDGADIHQPMPLYFDSSVNRLYIASHRYSNTAGYLAAELAVYSADGNTRLASVRLPIAAPTDIALVTMQGVNKVVVAAPAGGGVFPTEVVVVNPASMQVERRMPTLRGQHIAPAFQ